MRGHKYEEDGSKIIIIIKKKGLDPLWNSAMKDEGRGDSVAIYIQDCGLRLLGMNMA